MSLERRAHARSGLELTVFGFGGTPLRLLGARGDAAAAVELVDAAYDAGVRYFDAAPFYGSGLAEHRLGAALIDRPRDEFILSTKVGRLLRPGRSAAEGLPFTPEFDYSYDAVMRSFEDSLQRFGLDRIDILYVHDVSPRWQGEALPQRFREVMAGGYKALLRLREGGAIRAFGVGINDAQWCVRFADEGDFDLFMLAGRYTLLDQSAHEALLPLCQERGIGVVVAAPFNSGILASGAKPGATFFYEEAPAELMRRTARIEELCAKHGVALPAAALQYPLRHPAVLGVVAGSGNSAELHANLGHVTAKIPEALWQDLAAHGLTPPG